MIRGINSRSSRDVWRRVLAGEESAAARGSAAAVFHGEDGLVTWVTLIAILFLLVMACLIGNVGHTVAQKIETQNAADSVAYSGSIWMARGMNAITAANHLMGELMGLYVLHHAIGGKWLDKHYADGDKNSSPFPEQTADFALHYEWYIGHFIVAASRIPHFSDEYPVPVGSIFDDTTDEFKDPQTGDTTHYDVVVEDPVADTNSTNYQAKLRLKIILTGAFESHVVGFELWGLGKICEATLILAGLGEALVALGDSIMWIAYLTEWKVYQEYATLNALELLARTLSPVKQQIPLIMYALRSYQHVLFYELPGTARQSAQKIGERNRTYGCLAGPGLPVEEETTFDEERSQLMRATFPWVTHWRAPLLDFFSWAEILSGAEGYYRDWTNFYSLQLCTYFREQPGQDVDNDYDLYSDARRGYHLYVMQNLNPPFVEKGQEPWTSRGGSAEADELFCWVGIARRQSHPVLFGPPVFRQENPDGIICLSQAILYNANPQLGDAGGGSQPRVGWDTLNWDNPVPEHWSDSSDQPRIKLNWQTKLSPLTPARIRGVLSDPTVWTDPNDRKTIEALITRMGVIGAFGSTELMTH